MNLPTSILTKNQKKTFGPKIYSENGTTYKLTATVRYDDECGNGHNSFAITGAQYRKDRNNQWVEDSFGCIHDDISKHFPELAPLIKWHLTSSDGPWGYLANTIYFAGDKDCWGLRKDEPDPRHLETRIKFEGAAITHKVSGNFSRFIQAASEFNKRAAKTNPNYITFEPVAVPHPHKHDSRSAYKYPDNYTFKGLVCEWHKCPFDSLREAQEWQLALQGPYEYLTFPTRFGEGKERELDKARNAAIWPYATDDDLTAPGLEERLKARLPQLMQEFKAAVESLGFVY